jgi:hypothetical protein
MTQAIQDWKHRGTLTADNNAVAEPIVDTTFRKVEALSTQAIASGLTVDTANNQITATVAGDYFVAVSLSFSGSGNDTYYLEIFKNAAGTGYEVERYLSNADVGACSVSGIVTCAIGDDIALYQQSPTGGSTMTVTHAQMTVFRVG